MLVLLLIFHCHGTSSFSSFSSTSASAPSNPTCSALLQFNASLSHDSSDTISIYYCGYPGSPKIKFWNESTNCCGWEGVTCDEDNSHLIALDLSCSFVSLSLSTNTTTLVQLIPKTLQHLNLAFNPFNVSIPAQLFTHFVSLTHLNVSGCSFSGSIPFEISLLTQLVSLDLSGNFDLIFDNQYSSSAFDMFARNSSKLTTLVLDSVNMSRVPPSSLLNFTSLRLKHLSLVECGLHGEFPSGIFFLFSSLQYLDLTENYDITGHLPAQSNWSSPIEVLDFSYCDFRGPLPRSLGNLTQITSLSLSHNVNFGVGIPNVFGSLRQLRDLRLGSTNISGHLPSTIFNLTQISYLDLSKNSIEGGFPTAHVSGFQSLNELNLSSNLISGGLPSWLFTLPSLKILDLSHNNLGGAISSEMLSRLKALEELHLSNNNLLSLSDSDHGLVNYTIPELYILSFSSCNISQFPSSLRVARSLSELYLSHNKIQGSISKWGSEGWGALSILDLSYNLLTSFSLDQFSGKYLYTLDLRSNQLQGHLLTPPPSIGELSISENKLTGGIPPLICNCSSIRFLDLSRNKMSGIIPPCLANSSHFLMNIKLQMNNFYGQIPTFENDLLQNLILDDNQLEGPVPRSLVNCTNLVYINVANNNLNDTFPHWLGMLPELRYLILGSNRFHGRLYKSIFSKLQVIDLSQNEFTGSLPTEFFRTLSAYKVVSLDSPYTLVCFQGDCFSSSLDSNVKVRMKRLQLEIQEGNILPSFTLLDFSNNQFHGAIPDVVGELVGLHVLNLSHNYLTGPIPPTLGNMQALESLDLSSNKLCDRIPPEMTNLSFLEVFNVSQNNLEGPIPIGKQFNTFENDSYSGNPRLCGFPLSKKCGNMPEPPPSSSAAADDDEGIPFIWKVVMMGYGSGVVLGLSMGYIVFTTGRPWWIVRKIERDWQYNVTEWFRRFGNEGRRRRN